MDKKDFIKKYWFVCLVAILLVVFVVAYTGNAIKNKEVEVNTLTKEGKDVVLSYNNENYYFADDLYEDLYNLAGKNTAFNSLFHSLLNEVVPTTEELSTNAANWASYILENEEKDTIEYYMYNAGYNGIDGLGDYCIDSLKYNQFMNDVYTNNFDLYVRPIVEQEKPRYISHILVKVADIETNTDEDGNTTYTFHPTDEEQAKLNDVLEALKNESLTFEDIAAQYSEDGSSANGGMLTNSSGQNQVVTTSNSNQYVPPFAEAAMNLNDGQISDVVETEYGWHIIKCQIPSNEELLADQDFYSLIEQYNVNLDAKLILEHAEELGYEIVSQDLKDYIDETINADKEAQ